MTAPIAAQIACVKREIALRERVYPKWIAAGRMKQEAAEREIATMKAVLHTLTALADRDCLGKALLLVAKAKRRIWEARSDRNLSVGDFSVSDEWPELEPPAEADRTFAAFAAQDEGGRNICENWRREGDAVLAAIFARIGAQADRPVVVERDEVERKHPLGGAST